MTWAAAHSNAASPGSPDSCVDHSWINATGAELAQLTQLPPTAATPSAAQKRRLQRRSTPGRPGGTPYFKPSDASVLSTPTSLSRPDADGTPDSSGYYQDGPPSASASDAAPFSSPPTAHHATPFSPDSSAASVVSSVGSARGGPPDWVADHLVATCHACRSAFWLFSRKHHCRRCGNVFCGGCSNNFEELPHLQGKGPQRVCDACAVRLQRQREGVNVSRWW